MWRAQACAAVSRHQSAQDKEQYVIRRWGGRCQKSKIERARMMDDGDGDGAVKTRACVLTSLGEVKVAREAAWRFAEWKRQRSDSLSPLKQLQQSAMVSLRKSQSKRVQISHRVSKCGLKRRPRSPHGGPFSSVLVYYIATSW